MKCERCEGNGWIWAMGTDASEECSWCDGTGESKELDKPTVKLVEDQSFGESPKPSIQYDPFYF